MDSRYRLWIIAPLVGVALAAIGLTGLGAWERGEVLVDIRGLSSSDSVVQGFSMEKARDVEIDAVGAGSRPPARAGRASLRSGLGRAWIVDRASGAIVWELRDADTEPLRTDLDVFQGTLRFPAGDYIVHYVCEPSQPGRNTGSWVDWIDGNEDGRSPDSTAADTSSGFHITIRGRGRPLTEGEIQGVREQPADARPERATEREVEAVRPARVENEPQRQRGPDIRGVIVELTRLEDDEIASEVFTVNRRAEVRVYAVGEGEDGEMYDVGWIVSRSTGRTVWSMEYDETVHAGGARKNRVVNDTIRLRAGDYVVYFKTDASHSYDNWNESPPANERDWGITLSATRNRRGDFTVGQRREDTRSVLAQLVGIRQDERRRVRFSLDHRSTVVIYAIGEGERDGLYDYAWIENAQTRQHVWEMTYSNTSHAGGDEKNRMFNSTVWLPAGDYILRYTSDNSHSPTRWNADPPDDLLYYGVTVYREQR